MNFFKSIASHRQESIYSKSVQHILEPDQKIKLNLLKKINSVIEGVRNCLRELGSSFDLRAPHPNIHRITDDSFNIKLPNEQEVERTTDEATLHVLIETHLSMRNSARSRSNPSASSAQGNATSGSENKRSIANLFRNPFKKNPAQAQASQPAQGKVSQQDENVKSDRLSDHPARMDSDLKATDSAAAEQTPALVKTETASENESDKTPEAIEPNEEQALANSSDDVFELLGNNIRSINKNNTHFHSIKESIGANHTLKSISGAKNNCWWRSAWISALCQHNMSCNTDTSFGEKIKSYLGDSCTPHLDQIIDKLSSEFSNANIRDILTNLDSTVVSPMESASRIKYPSEPVDVDATEAEIDLEQVTFAIFTKMGLDHETARSMIFEGEPGDGTFSVMLIKALGGEGVLYQTEQDLLLVSETGNDFVPNENTYVAAVDISNKISSLPILKHNISHIEVLLPHSLSEQLQN